MSAEMLFNTWLPNSFHQIIFVSLAFNYAFNPFYFIYNLVYINVCIPFKIAHFKTSVSIKLSLLLSYLLQLFFPLTDTQRLFCLPFQFDFLTLGGNVFKKYLD